jgi:hypothetical protein
MIADPHQRFSNQPRYAIAAYVSKPLHPQELFQAMNQLLSPIPATSAAHGARDSELVSDVPLEHEAVLGPCGP